MRLIGIDPGEEWVGYAAMQFDFRKGTVSAESRVLSMNGRGIVGMTDLLVPTSFVEPTYIVEDFRVRPTGFNRYTKAPTIRLIGALQYAVHEASTWHLVPPGNAAREVPMLFGGLFDKWKHRWPDRGNERWAHCYSAWRVLGRYLLAGHLDILPKLRRVKVYETWALAPHWIPVDHSRAGEDLVAPAARWVF